MTCQVIKISLPRECCLCFPRSPLYHVLSLGAARTAQPYITNNLSVPCTKLSQTFRDTQKVRHNAKLSFIDLFPYIVTLVLILKRSLLKQCPKGVGNKRTD